MSATVVVLGTLRFPPDKIREVIPHLQRLVEMTRKFDNCISYDVAEDPFDPGLIRFSELWPDRETLDRHLLADHIEPWRTAAKKFGLSDRKFVAYQIQGSWNV